MTVQDWVEHPRPTPQGWIVRTTPTNLDDDFPYLTPRTPVLAPLWPVDLFKAPTSLMIQTSWWYWSHGNTNVHSPLTRKYSQQSFGQVCHPNAVPEIMFPLL